MRQDSAAFAQQNQAIAKHPRLVVKMEFDVASSYATSDPDMVDVPGTNLLGHLQNVSAVSQEIHPDEARSTIGSMSFSLVDIDEDLTDELREQLADNFQNLRGRTVELRLGYTSDYDDTKILFTQQVKACEYEDGVYRITCNDVQRETRKEIFEPFVTTLRLTVDADDTTIPVQDTSDFSTVFHGASYSDSPSSTVGYFRLDDEIIRYTGKTADSFTGCTRGVFNTVAVAHEVQSGADAERQPEVTEFIYLELPGPKLAYAVLTGALDGDSASLPDHWHLGVATALVSVTQFQQIGPDLYDTTDDDATLVLRFSGLEKTDGKRFLEEQVYQPLGLYSPVLADGSLGLRRMNHILADAPYVMVLDEKSFTQVGALVHDFDALLNVFSIDWNYDPIADRFTRRRKIIDQDSIDVHGEADTKELAWEGLHGSRHTDAVLLKRSDSIRDRYAGPPLRLTGNLLHRYNVLEVGDVVRVQLDHVRDYTGDAGAIDRSFEVQRIAVDQISGEVSVSLFGSSQRSSVLPPDTGTALPDGWYDVGTELSTVVTIVDDVIQPGTYNLTGNASLTNSGAIYYYLGDLELADGATLTINDNVQLRIRGFLTINGTIDGVGNGQAGKVDDDVLVNANAGSPGFVGNTRGWEGVNHVGTLIVIPFMERWASPLTMGKYSAFPFLELSVIDDDLVGLPADLRGTSGGIGGRIMGSDGGQILEEGGTGGASGAGLAIICRGASLGASGSIDVSGGDGVVGEQESIGHSDIIFQAGSGAPGGPGSVLCVIDGSTPSIPDILSGLTASFGSTPSAGEQPTGETGEGYLEWAVESVRAGYNTSITGDIAASVLRIQRLAGEQTPEEDVIVPAPIALVAGSNEAANAHVLTSTPPPSGIVTEYFGSITNDRGDAVLLGDSSSGRFVTTPKPSTVTYYWARNRDIGSRRVSGFYPATTTSTVTGGALDFTATSSFVASVYKRASSAPSTPTTDDGSYNFTMKTLTPPAGWSATPPTSDGNPLYVSTGIFQVEGSTGTDETVTWTTPAILVSDGAAGVDGAAGAAGNSSIVVQVFQRAATAPSTPTADDGSYNFTSKTLTPPSGWSATPPAPNGDPLYVSVGIFEVAGTTGTDSTVTWTTPGILQSDLGDLILGNGIVNGGFEAGDIGWTKIAFTIIEDADLARFGTWVARTDNVSTAFLLSDSPMQVAEGDRVLAQAYFQVTIGTASARVRIVWLDSAGDALSQTAGNSVTFASAQTAFVISRVVAVAPANAVSARLDFQVFGGASDTDVFGDGAYMAIIPRGSDIVLDDASGTVSTVQIDANSATEVYSAVDVSFVDTLSSPSVAKSAMALGVGVTKDNATDVVQVIASGRVTVTGSGYTSVGIRAYRTLSGGGSEAKNSMLITANGTYVVSVVGTWASDPVGTHSYGLGYSIILDGGGVDTCTITYEDINLSIGVFKR